MENINLDLFHPQKAELQKMADSYKDLKINGLEDKEGFKIVHEAQMVLKNARVNIKKTRLSYTRQFDEAKKNAIGLEKELLGIITPIEEDLKAQKEQIEAEKERIKEEERQKKAEALQNRVDALAKYDFNYTNLSELAEMKPEDFETLVNEKKEIFEKAEAERIEKEKIEKENNLKNELRGKIINTKTIQELDSLEDYIENDFGNDFLVDNFSEDIKKKKEMLEFDKKQAEFKKQQDKLKADKEKLEKEKKEKAEAEETERINGLRSELIKAGTLEEIKKVFYTFTDLDKEALEKDFDNLSYKFIEKIKKAEEKKKTEEEKQAKLEKRKKYKDFLSKNNVTTESIESGEYTISKNEDLKIMTIYKKIDTFKY